MQFYDYFLQLCAKKGVSPTKAAKEMNLSNATATRWANRGSIPNNSTLMRIALYFDIPYSEVVNFPNIEETPGVAIVGRSQTSVVDRITEESRKLPVIDQEKLLKYILFTYADEL